MRVLHSLLPSAHLPRPRASSPHPPTAPISPRTLKDGLKGHNLDTETLVTILFAELKAYKTVRADTGQERYNVLCDLLELCSEESGRLHQRAVGLTELAQVLCYHSYSQQTEWWVPPAMLGSSPKVPESP